MKQILLLIGLAMSLSLTVQAQEENAYPVAEYDPASVIVMHEPGEELFVGILHPAAALFLDFFSQHKAVEEHRNYRNILRENGATVYTVRDILLKDCVDDNGDAIEGEALTALRELTSSSLTYVCGEGVDSVEQAAYREAMIGALHPNDLVNIILKCPTVYLRTTGINTHYEASYSLAPVMNLFFMRDQVITTQKGIVVGQMNSSQRAAETDIAEFCYRKLGETPIYRISGEGAYLEGGDYLPFGSLSLIGCGLRTTQEAIDQLMENDLIGKDTLVVVRDSWKSQDQMHLDTYFNIIDKDLVTLCANRVNAQPGDVDYLTVDVYAKNASGAYQKISENRSFVDFLTSRGITIIPIESEDEKNFANNFLTIGARKIVMVAGQSEALQAALSANGVEVIWADLYNLTRGYGAAHCMTQVIRRVPESSTPTNVTAATSAATCSVSATEGYILIRSEEPCHADIYTSNGVLVNSVHDVVNTRIPKSPGFYVVKTDANPEGVKVQVK